MFASFGVFVLFLYLAVQFLFAVGSKLLGSFFFFFLVELRPDGLNIELKANKKKCFPPSLGYKLV